MNKNKTKILKLTENHCCFDIENVQGDNLIETIINALRNTISFMIYNLCQR